MLNEMGDAVGSPRLMPRADADPGADHCAFRLAHVIGRDAQAIGQSGDFDGHFIKPSSLLRVPPPLRGRTGGGWFSKNRILFLWIEPSPNPSRKGRGTHRSIWLLLCSH